MLLFLGSIFLASDDWDFGVCLVMGLPAYVLAPWAFRQVYYIKWKCLLLAALAFWISVDGTYSLYWYLRDFEYLALFRPANFTYCTPIFWMAGFVFNLDFAHFDYSSTGFRCSRKGLFRLLVHLFYVIVLAFVIVCSVRMVSGVDRLTKEVCERKIVEEIHFESEIQPALNQLRNKMGNDCKV